MNLQVSSSSDNRNQRIALNTLQLFVRLILVTLISFYTSRLLYNLLGIEDFGLFALVTSMVSVAIFFTTSLSNATQRYLSYYLGQDDIVRARQVVALSLKIYIIIGVVAWVLGEIVGMYLLEYRLSIPADKLGVVKYVYHMLLFVQLAQMVLSIAESVLISHEHMIVYTRMGIAESLLKLGIVASLVLIPIDRLLIYTALLSGLLIVVRLYPVVVCYRLYPECQDLMNSPHNPDLLRRMMGFVGWNGVSTAAWAICNNGFDLLLNMFGGPVLNAARGIAGQISTTIGNFAQNIFSAMRSRLIMSYASGEYTYFEQLLHSASRFGVYAVWIVALPVMMRVEALLDIWLGEVPPAAYGLVIWTLIYTLGQGLLSPMWIGIQASGKIRSFVVWGSIVTVGAIPFVYWILKMNGTAVLALQILILSRVAQLVVSWLTLSQQTQLSGWNYIRLVVVPMLGVGVTSWLVSWGLNAFIPDTLIGTGIHVVLTVGATAICVGCIGISRAERIFMLSYIKRYIP